MEDEEWWAGFVVGIVVGAAALMIAWFFYRLMYLAVT
jgi:hypothetical protein